MKQDKTRLYLIRHGETEWNKGGRYQGWTDIELSEEGKWQAALLAKRFEYMPLDAIYVSPLKRAVATAEPIAKQKGLPLIMDEHFKEINFGEWEGHTVAELTEKYGKPYTDFFHDPFAHTMPGEGSFHKVAERSLAGFQEIIKKHRGQRVAIVSHGGLLRVFMIKLLGLDLNLYRKMWLTNTSISMIDITPEDQMFLMTLNDKAHLEMAELLKNG
ncbi:MULTISPECIES: histidine phosphatase family protein [Anaerotignum]|uniref:histidine phosphatase family protein n=1 Tax=Anaerotignum TaxID=2039240 RepID=UPI00210BBA31|nr:MULTISPECIES: histidine phosphatase family protein [Anaerotignum]MCQ4936974.1 histidine phosphatase family protein [Anaerotignum propionicum]